MNAERVKAKHVRRSKRNWKSHDFGEKIKELKNPTTMKYKLLRVYYRVHPFTSINAKVNELVQKDELQDEIVNELDKMEEVVEDLQNDLKKWRNIVGETS